MSDKHVFTVSDKLVKLRDGAAYDLANYVEGTDYVQRKIRYGTKVVFRKGFLGEVEPALPGEPEDKPQHASLVLDEKGLRIEFNEPKQGPQQPVSDAYEGLLPQHCPVEEQKVMKIHANYKWVDTDKGRVWVGLKGSSLRLGQVIRVKNGELYLKRV
jgi:hypothetical protein